MFRMNFPVRTLLPLLSISALTLLTGATHASAGKPPVIEITAKRFAFSPDKITLKRGETVILTITPEQAGTFTTICDHFCGANHGNMNMTIVVE